MALSVRTRFEVFKRDDFRCRYCGRQSPEVVLEVDHIVPKAAGGSDDEMNLTTSCWDCNRGKAAKPLAEVMTGEDPHDKAIALLERARQLREYNEVLAAFNKARCRDAEQLARYWEERTGSHLTTQESSWLLGVLKYCPREIVWEFMEKAIAKGLTRSTRYIGGCVRSWRQEHGLAPEPQIEGVE